LICGNAESRQHSKIARRGVRISDRSKVVSWTFGGATLAPPRHLSPFHPKPTPRPPCHGAKPAGASLLPGVGGSCAVMRPRRAASASALKALRSQRPFGPRRPRLVESNQLLGSQAAPLCSRASLGSALQHRPLLSSSTVRARRGWRGCVLIGAHPAPTLNQSGRLADSLRQNTT